MEMILEVTCQMTRFVMAPMFDAIAYMNRKAYVHREIKPQNILVDGKGVPKLCDFGQAIKLDSRSGFNKGEYTGIGSSYYMSPEAAIGVEYGPCIDSWSMGISMLVLAYGYGPYHFRTADIVFHPQPDLPKNIVVDVTYFANWYRKEVDEESVNSRIRQMLKISRNNMLESESEHEWQRFRRFIGKLVKFKRSTRIPCTGICDLEYMKKPLIEWQTHNFQQFKNVWTDWQDVLDATR